MSRLQGELRVCDRCGRTEFFKLIGRKDLDGGFTSVNQFEAANDWTHEYVVGDLCPECSAAWEKIRQDFIKKAAEL